ncbi:MAG TPA: VanZ family protein [Pirellulales bacterium]|nr:VanZ family protein [Pirellulales bacterium]
MPEPLTTGHFKRRAATAALVLYWLTLLTATHWPYKVPPAQQPMLSSDKLLHFSAYAGLGFLLTFVAWTRNRPGKPLPILALLLVAVTAGFVDEITQPLTARDFEWMDWVADILGALSGVGLGIAATRYLTRSSRANYDDSGAELSP